MSDLLDRLAAVFTDEELTHMLFVKKPSPDTPVAVPAPTSGLTRITAPDGGPLSHAYATVDPWNCDHTGLLLHHSGGRVGLHYPDGRFGLILPGARHDGHAVWSRKDPFIFYMTTGNQLQAYDVRKNSLTTIRTFNHDHVDIGVQEGDISEDGDYLPICGDGVWASLYQISADHVGPVYQIEGLNAVYVTPDNNLLVTGPGIQLIRPGGSREIVPNFGHMDVARDLDGQECIVWTNNNDNGIYKIRLNDPGNPIHLITLDWKLACHISLPYPKVGQKPLGYAIVSPYAPGGEDVLYADSILKVPLDGSPVKVIAHYKSDTTTGSDVERYSGQPHAVASGNQFLFDAREKGENVVYIGSL